MKNIMTIFALALGLSIHLTAIESTPSNNHRLYIEPDFSFYLEHEIEVNDEAGSPRFKEWGQYYGLNAGYEFLKPNDFYAGVEANVSFGNQYVEINHENAKLLSPEKTAYKNKLEGRVGCMLLGKDITFIPFSGVGGYFLSQGKSYMNLTYIPFGVKTEILWDNFTVGIKAENLTFVHSWISLDSKKSKAAWGPDINGYEISMPISFKSRTRHKAWSAAIEPYFLKIFEKLEFVGGRISAVYQY